MSKLTVSVSPHIYSKTSTQTIMLDVIIALLPATVAGVVIFGIRSLAVIAVAVATAVLSEFLFNLICKREQTISDLSAIVTGLLLALNLPAEIPLWQTAVGAVFGIIFVKCVFGGIGQNFANPAITARVFMIISFSGTLIKVSSPVIVDTVSGATPLTVIEGISKGIVPSIKDLFFGVYGGTIGETCSIALLLGFVYLMIRKVISWHTPVTYIATVFILALVISGSFNTALVHVLSGGLLIGAIFMATDYSTSPTSYLGKAVFGVGCGLITVLIRFWGNFPEGVSFAIFIMNIITPYIDKLTAKKHFGGVKK